VRVAIIVPTLGRSHALAPLLANLRETTPLVYRVCFVVDVDDLPTMRTIAGMPPANDFFVIPGGGSYPAKTNAGVAATDEDLVLPTADDVVFHDGWYETALKHFEAGAQVVGTNDLSPATAGGALATMPIVRRSYVEDPGAAYGEPGVLFHEGYHHNAVDRELWELAQHRGVAVFEPESIIEHRHPSWGTREVDETDRKGNLQHRGADTALFEHRQARWLA
jgi:glycosyl transferase family 2